MNTIFNKYKALEKLAKISEKMTNGDMETLMKGQQELLELFQSTYNIGYSEGYNECLDKNL